jgi:hypothetical protein
VSEDQSYLLQPPITLICPPELKSRLMLRIADWASDATGNLDAGITVRTAPRDRDYVGAEPGQTYFTIVPGVFVLYDDPPFTGNGGETIAWWNAPLAYIIDASDIEPAAQAR